MMAGTTTDNTGTNILHEDEKELAKIFVSNERSQIVKKHKLSVTDSYFKHFSYSANNTVY